MELSEGRASGKVILLGEHAVVYGVPALAIGIERGARAVLGREHEAHFAINATAVTSPEAHQALAALRQAMGAPALSVDVELELPAGAGLGASAALGVAIARAFAAHLKLPADTPQVLLGAEAWEQVFHGNPSGIDTAAAYHGGCFEFRRGHPPQFLELKAPLGLAIAQAAPPASTKAMVESVARLRERRPELVDKTLEGIRSLVNNARLCLQAGDWSGLGKLMDYNQMLLSGLFLSTPELETACSIARAHGAYGAKLTGAGGGGCVIAVAEEPESIVEAWAQREIQGFVTRVEPSTRRAPTSSGAPA